MGPPSNVTFASCGVAITTQAPNLAIVLSSKLYYQCLFFILAINEKKN
jgi:hypothetical protein